jgi:hypothetical protein
VIGALEASNGWLIKKRPSRETIYSCLLAPEPGATLTGKSATGVPAVKVAPDVVIVEAINFPSPPIKKISLPSGRHRGWIPPPVETCHLAVAEGNGCTTISSRPDYGLDHLWGWGLPAESEVGSTSRHENHL